MKNAGLRTFLEMLDNTDVEEISIVGDIPEPKYSATEAEEFVADLEASDIVIQKEDERVQRTDEVADSEAYEQRAFEDELDMEEWVWEDEDN